MMLTASTTREKRYLLHNLITPISFCIFLFGTLTNISIRARLGRPSDTRLGRCHQLRMRQSSGQTGIVGLGLFESTLESLNHLLSVFRPVDILACRADFAAGSAGR
jgi:hypothetical protein